MQEDISIKSKEYSEIHGVSSLEAGFTVNQGGPTKTTLLKAHEKSSGGSQNPFH